MWGTRQSPDLVNPCIRFIPTHVGNSVSQPSRRLPGPVHPHACGELHNHSVQVDLPHGSSPRMWGTQKGVGSERCWIRFIPTHVGNSLSAARSAPFSAVHPHACGELSGAPVSLCASYGSSPRMWGTLVEVFREIWRVRFIPTHVGNSRRLH